MVNNLKHLSVSSIQKFVDCQYCWKLNYIDKIPEPSNPYAEFGSRYHEEVDNYHKGLEYKKEVISHYVATYEQRYRLTSESSVTEILKVDDYKTDIPIKLILDGLVPNGICDLKTGKAKPTKGLQTDIYGAWYYMTYNQEPDFYFNWFKNKSEFVDVKYHITKERMINAINFINYIYGEIMTTHFTLPSRAYFHHPECIWKKG